MSDQELRALIEANQHDLRVASACVLFMSVLSAAYVVLGTLY